jgi:hypothetical protein
MADIASRRIRPEPLQLVPERLAEILPLPCYAVAAQPYQVSPVLRLSIQDCDYGAQNIVARIPSLYTSDKSAIDKPACPAE